MLAMTDMAATAGVRRVLCPAEIHLTVAEQQQLDGLPRGSSEVPWTLGCALDVGHDEDHHVEAQSTDLNEDGQLGDIWWIRWNDRGLREIAVLPPCPITQSHRDRPDRDLCLLFDGHPGRHSFLPGRHIDHLAEYLDYSHQATRLAANDPAGAQVAATLALAAAINRLVDGHPHSGDTTPASTATTPTAQAAPNAERPGRG